MKKLLLTCGALALLSGASAAAAQNQLPEKFTQPQGPTGAVINQPVFSFNAGDPANPVQVEVDLGPTSLFAVATLDKDVVTNELITFNTYVNLNQTVDATNTTDFAEASAMGVQTNSNNKDCSNCAEKTDTIGGNDSGGSADHNTGLVSINQAAGNNNNQGTLVSVAVDSATHGTGTPPQPPTPVTPTSVGGGVGFAHAQAEATQFNGSTPLSENGNTVETVDLIYRNANILNSFDNNTGLIYGNQSTGNNNNQLNELSLAFAEQPQGVAIAETDLGQFNTDNVVGESASVAGGPIGINKAATISASLNSNTGVFGVNQSVGNNGNQANIVSVAAVGTNLPTFH
ncbi:MAG: hypothetical protein ACHP7N_08135 [Caulobacterales bacterium]